MNRREAERQLQQELKTLYGDGEASAMARLVLEDFEGADADASASQNVELSSEEQQRINGYLQRLQQHQPVQYVLNKAWFYELPLYVNPSVLIPRPETEELVDWIIKDIRALGKALFDKAPTNADATTQLKMLDVGTGSGCIALALKKAVPLAEVWGCDVSEEALTVARRNGSTLDIRVDFQGLDFLDEAQRKALPAVAIIVSNPPYIPLSESSTMHRNVTDHEPHKALFVPDNDPLIFYKAIAAFAKKRLYPTGSIYLEVHENRGEEVVNFFREEGFTSVELKKDMQGKERMVRVKSAAV